MRVLELRDCVGSCKSWVPKRSKVSAIDVTAKIFFECLYLVLGQTEFKIQFSVLIEMFVTSISIRGTFKSFWDLTEVSEQSWYKVLTYELVNPTLKVSLLQICAFHQLSVCSHNPTVYSTTISRFPAIGWFPVQFFPPTAKGYRLNFFTDIHGGVGWLGDGERYYFSFHFFFVPRTHFLVQNLVNFGGNLFWREIERDVRRIVDEKVYRKV